VALAALQGNQRPELKQLTSAISVSTETNRVRVAARFPYEVLDALQPRRSAPRASEAPPSVRQ
jgi:hypothetical protein